MAWRATNVIRSLTLRPLGSNASIKRFRHNLHAIIKADVTPFYRFKLDDRDIVTVRPRQTPAKAYTPTVRLARLGRVARSLGWDYHVLRSNWLSFAQAESAKGNPLENAGVAFLA